MFVGPLVGAEFANTPRRTARRLRGPWSSTAVSALDRPSPYPPPPGRAASTNFRKLASHLPIVPDGPTSFA